MCQDEELDYTYMNTILDYLTIDILTMYENNIKQHYIDYVERYVNVVWKQKFMTNQIRKVKKTKKDREAGVRNLNTQLRKIKNDLLNIENNEYKSKFYYHQWIQENHKLVIPNKKNFKKDNLYYDLQCCPLGNIIETESQQCNPQDYLSCMIYIMKYVEEQGFTTINPFPLRNDIIPKHIRLDTTTLVHLLMTKEQGNKTDYLFNGNLKRFEDKIWNFFFRTERQCFKKNWYSFHHMIETDGGSCEKFMIRENPKPYKNNLRLVHGLISCKSCSNVWNRDCNGSKNIYKIAYNSIHSMDRPSYLCRNSSGVLDDITKTKIYTA